MEAAGQTSVLEDSEAALVLELHGAGALEDVKAVEVGSSVAVRDLADQLGVEASDVQRELIELGVLASVNQAIPFEQAKAVGEKLGFAVKPGEGKPAVKRQRPKTHEKGAWIRPPVVTVLGHVDHGKTSLLDAIRHASVTAGEFGGITQHIGAYQVTLNDKVITFIDTPGHAAFTAMRARGAQVTDIAILVVAADDGVMPQTREAIDHAKAAGVPIIVALNKIDRPEANPDRIKQQLAEHELVPEDWGGDTMVVPVSATEKTGLDDLLEAILLHAEMLELTADPAAEPKGVVIESRLEKGKGAIATVLVQNGTLKAGAAVVIGSTHGKIRSMTDEKGQRVPKAGPGTPVEISGLANVPNAGDTLAAAADERAARQVAEQRQTRERDERLVALSRVSLDDLYRKLSEGETKELAVLLKCDVDGSAEAIRQSLADLGTKEVAVNVVQSAVGTVGENDVLLASASKAIIIAFNVRVEKEAYVAAERERVEIRQYNIIYELLDDVRKAMAGLLEPEKKEEVTGHAEVRALFKTPSGIVAGCYVTDGKMQRGTFARVLRNKQQVFQGRLDSLRHFKDDVREMAAGFECGIQFDSFNDIQEGDVIEGFVVLEIARTL